MHLCMYMCLFVSVGLLGYIIIIIMIILLVQSAMMQNIYMYNCHALSVCIFIRNLEHSTILYEDQKQQPLLRLAWNRQDPNYLATFAVDSPEVCIVTVVVVVVVVVCVCEQVQNNQWGGCGMHCQKFSFIIQPTIML